MFCELKWVPAIVLCLISFDHLGAQTETGLAESRQMRMILTENHFSPPLIDDNFSKGVFDRIFSDLDPARLYFTATDVASLQSFATRIDDEWSTDKNDFLIALNPVFKSVLQRAAANATRVEINKIDWNGNADYQPVSLPVANEAELKKRWDQWLRFNLLSNIRYYLDRDSVTKAVNLSFLIEHENDDKKKILNREQKNIQKLLESPLALALRIENAYLRAIAGGFDPHSIYFPASEAENLIGALSSQKYSFGLMLGENTNGDTRIERLIPGGPAWKSGAMHRGDVLISMKLEEQKEIDLMGIGLEELNQLFEGNHLTMQLTIANADGVRTTVLLRKEKIADDNSIVKGFVLHGKNKVGYISLPGFYSDLGSQGGSSCANDVAKQILKMKKENILGLIVDLRSNGGGSVAEAAELAGIFIDQGPLAVFKTRGGTLITLKDFNRGTIYDGPLVVLIDGRSASASELIAASLQDYNRAIIAGSRSFGKATGQRIFSIDPKNENTKADSVIRSDVGMVTVTIEKLYRVTGTTVQGSGVGPDILLPDLYGDLDEHESDLTNALTADLIVAKPPFQPLPVLPILELQERSRKRVANNKWFQLVGKASENPLLKARKSKESVSLNWKSFLDRDGLTSVPNGLSNDAPFDEVTVPEFNKAIGMNPFVAESNRYWFHRLENDEYVGEAFRLIDDCIGLKK